MVTRTSERRRHQRGALALVALLALPGCFTCALWGDAEDGRENALPLGAKIGLTPVALLLDGLTFPLQICIAEAREGRADDCSSH